MWGADVGVDGSVVAGRSEGIPMVAWRTVRVSSHLSIIILFTNG